MHVVSAELRDNAPLPNGAQQIVFADHTVSIADQAFEQIEDLGFDSHKPASPSQLAPAGIKHVVLESIAQSAPRLWTAQGCLILS